MIKIIPAVLPQRYSEIEQAVEKIGGAVGTVQIDFVDGKFAPNKTWWFNGKDTETYEEFMREEKGLPQWQYLNYEFDLMIADPLVHADTFTVIGPSKLIFHIESLETEKALQYFETLPEIVKGTVQFGIAIGIGTDPALIAPYLSHISSVQCMGIADVGFQHHPFDPRAIELVKEVRKLYPDITIGVDGGVTEENIPVLVAAGATELVVGSAIFESENPALTIKELSRTARRASADTEASL